MSCFVSFDNTFDSLGEVATENGVPNGNSDAAGDKPNVLANAAKSQENGDKSTGTAQTTAPNEDDGSGEGNAIN